MSRTVTLVRQAVGGIFGTALMGAVLFGAAGRIDIPMFWWVIATLGILNLVGALGVDPGLLKERRKPGPGGRDKFMVYASQVLYGVALIVAGLDVGRFRWTSVPQQLQVAGLIGAAVGLGIAIWAFVANPFFSAVVRHQKERGHRVITGGPYRFVRHPGYTGILVASPSLALALGSWIAMIPMVLMIPLIFRRLFIEDLFLKAELEGYREYARRVPHLLFPWP